MQIPPIEPEGKCPDDLINESYSAADQSVPPSPASPELTNAPVGKLSDESESDPTDLFYNSTLESTISLPPGEHRSADPASEAKGQFYTLDSRFVKSERLGSMIFACLVLFGALIWIAIRWWMEGVDLFLGILAVATLVVVAMLAMFAWIWPKKEFRHTHWRATDAGLEVHKGVFWRHRIIVPMSRVQHADVTQGPIQRMFGLGTLVVHTAGTSNASVDLAGIDHQAAIEVRDMIIRFRSDKQERQA